MARSLPHHPSVARNAQERVAVPAPTLCLAFRATEGLSCTHHPSLAPNKRRRARSAKTCLPSQFSSDRGLFDTHTTPPPQNARQRARSALHLNFREGEGLFTHPLLKPCSNHETESSKRGWTSSVMALVPQLRASATHTREQGTSNEKTRGLYLTDPFDQSGGMTLLAEKLPRVRFEFVGKTPPQHLNVEISTYWNLLPRRGGNQPGFWRVLLVSPSTPTFARSSRVPSNLRGGRRKL